MSSKLSQKELEKIIEKLRSQYEEYVKKYGEGLYSRKSFDERYLKALRERIDLQTFVLAEVGAFEDKKKMTADKEREAKIRTDLSFTKKVEALIEKMSEKIRAYPALLPDEDLPEEINHFAGGLKDFMDRLWYPLRSSIPADDLKNLKCFNELTAGFQKFVHHTTGGVPYEVEKFLFTSGKSGMDRARIEFLREAAVFLGSVNDFLIGLAEGPGRHEAGEEPEKTAEPSSAVAAAWKQLSRLIADFRFGDLI